MAIPQVAKVIAKTNHYFHNDKYTTFLCRFAPCISLGNTLGCNMKDSKEDYAFTVFRTLYYVHRIHKWTFLQRYKLRSLIGEHKHSTSDDSYTFYNKLLDAYNNGGNAMDKHEVKNKEYCVRYAHKKLKWIIRTKKLIAFGNLFEAVSKPFVLIISFGSLAISYYTYKSTTKSIDQIKQQINISQVQINDYNAKNETTEKLKLQKSIMQTNTAKIDTSSK